MHADVCAQQQPAAEYPLLCLLIVQADETLARFLDFCTYGHMIDNVVLIVTGTLHERDVQVRAVVLQMLTTVAELSQEC